MGEKHFFHFSTAVSGTVYLFHFDSWREDEQSMRFIFQGIFDRIRDLLPSCILPGKVKSNQLNMILFPQTLLKKLGLIDKTVSSFFFFLRGTSRRQIHRSKAIMIYNIPGFPS